MQGSEALGYFQWSIWDSMIGMRLSKELVQQSCKLYLTWTPAQILEHNRTSSIAGSKTPVTPKMEIFVTWVDGWRPQTNFTKSFILDVAMVLDTSLWNNYQLITNIKIDLFFLIIWILLWPQLLTNLAINNKIPIILINDLIYTTTFFIIEYLRN